MLCYSVLYHSLTYGSSFVMALSQLLPPGQRVLGQSKWNTTRQKLIHHHQLMFTVSNQNNVYSILTNWCICINISCGNTCLNVGVAMSCVALELTASGWGQDKRGRRRSAAKQPFYMIKGNMLVSTVATVLKAKLQGKLPIPHLLRPTHTVSIWDGDGGLTQVAVVPRGILFARQLGAFELFNPWFLITRILPTWIGYS